MRLTSLILMIVALLTLTGCFNPQFEPVAIKPSQIPNCGDVKTISKGDKVILRKSDARCLKRQLALCAYDRQRLLIANRANVKIINNYIRGRR